MCEDVAYTSAYCTLVCQLSLRSNSISFNILHHRRTTRTQKATVNELPFHTVEVGENPWGKENPTRVNLELLTSIVVITVVLLCRTKQGQLNRGNRNILVVLLVTQHRTRSNSILLIFSWEFSQGNLSPWCRALTNFSELTKATVLNGKSFRFIEHVDSPGHCFTLISEMRQQ